MQPGEFFVGLTAQSRPGCADGDETYISPNPQKMHKDRKARLQARDGLKAGFVGKTAVQGILDRELRQVCAKVLPNLRRETSQKKILDNVTSLRGTYVAVEPFLLDRYLAEQVFRYNDRTTNPLTDADRFAALRWQYRKFRTRD